MLRTASWLRLARDSFVSAGSKSSRSMTSELMELLSLSMPCCCCCLLLPPPPDTVFPLLRDLVWYLLPVVVPGRPELFFLYVQ